MVQAYMGNDAYDKTYKVHAWTKEELKHAYLSDGSRWLLNDIQAKTQFCQSVSLNWCIEYKVPESLVGFYKEKVKNINDYSMEPIYQRRGPDTDKVKEFLSNEEEIWGSIEGKTKMDIIDVVVDSSPYNGKWGSERGYFTFIHSGLVQKCKDLV